MKLQQEKMSPILRIGLCFVFGFAAFIGIMWLKSFGADNKTKSVFIGKVSADPAFQRVAMQRLSQAILSDKSTMIFRIQWTAERNGKTTNPEIVYNRIPQTLTDGLFEYSNVTDNAIHMVSAKRDAVVGLTEFGATQKVILNGKEYKPTNS